MTSNNFAFYGAKILGELIRDIVFFPFWWFTKGVLGTTKSLAKWLQAREKALGLSVWIKNLLRPMYGQTDWQGKLISFFVRLIEIIFRSAIMVFWVMVALIMFAFWIALPIFVVYQIIFQLMP